MTGEDDSGPASNDKVASDAQRFNEALERLGQLPTELQEPMPALPSRLLPLGGLDLLEPGIEAFALWVLDRLCTGKLIAYGRPTVGKRYRMQAIPAGDWPGLVLRWSTGQAEHEIAQNCWSGVAWSELGVSADADLTPNDPIEESTTFTIVLSDAIEVAQSWRERQLIPVGYLWEHGEFWKANPDLRPNRGETAAAIEVAIRAGGLSTICRKDGEWFHVPASAWNASTDRADLAHGRLNLGPDPSGGLLRFGRWHLVSVFLRELLDWCKGTWARGQVSPADNPAQEASAQIEEDEVPSTRLGRRPEWPWQDIMFDAAVCYMNAAGDLKLEALVAEMQRIAAAKHKHGRQPHESTARPYAREVRDWWERRGEKGGK